MDGNSTLTTEMSSTTMNSAAHPPFTEGPNRLERRLAEILRQAQRDGELDSGLGADHEAASLLSVSHGLGTSVLVGQRTADSAAQTLRYHLDRLFGV